MHIRKPLFIVFLVSYVVTLPFVISYALGFDLVEYTRGRIIRTGGIFVTSTPPKALLTIDNGETTWKTPQSVISLRTGKHRVSLAMEGFRPWEKEVVVKPGEVTVVNDALLIPEKWKRTTISQGVFTDIVPVSCGPFLLLRRGDLLGNLYAYDTRDERLAPLVPRRSPLSGAVVRAIHAVPGSTALIIEVEGSARRRVLQAKLQWPKAAVTDVTRLFPSPAVQMQWTTQDPDDVFILKGTRLDRINISTRRTVRRVARDCVGFTFWGKDILALDTENRLKVIDPDTSQWEVVHDFDSLLRGLASPAQVSISSMGPGSLILHEAGGVMAVERRDARYAVTGVLGCETDAYTARVLLWQKGAAAVVEMAPPIGEQQAGDTAGGAAAKPSYPRADWFSIGEGEIRQAWLAYGATHVLCHAGNEVFLVGPDRGGRRISSWIATVAEGSMAYYSDHEGRLYFIDAQSRKASWVPVIQHSPRLEGFILDIRSRTGNY